MRNLTTIRNIAVAVVTVATLAVGSSANAEGFLAGLAKPVIGAPAARALDQAHARMGNPLDHAANQMAGRVVDATIAPGYGTAVTAALEARDQARRMNGGAQHAPQPQLRAGGCSAIRAIYAARDPECADEQCLRVRLWLGTLQFDRPDWHDLPAVQRRHGNDAVSFTACLPQEPPLGQLFLGSKGRSPERVRAR